MVFVFCFSLKAVEWREIDPAEFELTESEIDPGFGAEILFSELEFRQEFLGEASYKEVARYYMRFRVYNELGVSQLANWKLPYEDRRGGIGKIEGRTVKPSGAVYELSQDHIFDTELVRKGKVDLAAKSFAFPNLEPGDIVELQYLKRTTEIDWMPVLRFQERLPARRITKRINPLGVLGIGYKVRRFNFSEDDFSDIEPRFYVAEKRNIKAIVDEPFSLPDSDLIPTVIIDYFDDSDRPKDGEDYWAFRAKTLHREGKKALAPSNQIEALAKELTEGKQSDWAKLEALYDYCQNEVLNINYSRGILTDKERSKIKESNKPQATLARGNGTPEEVTYLFGALANAAGFAPRIAAMHDNRFMKFKGWLKHRFAMRLRYIAIDLDGETHYFRPGNPFLYCGEVEWFAANSGVLEAARKNGAIKVVKQRGADYSVRKRTLTGALDQEGRLTARVEIEMSGYSGWDAKERMAELEGREAREEYFADQIKDLMPQAKVENITISNSSSHKYPIRVTYDLEIPDYADVTRRRLYFQPYVFGKGAQDIFVSNERVSPIQFNYAATSVDKVSIQMPEGLVLEDGVAPKSLDLGAFGNYTVSIRSSKEGVIQYERTFSRNVLGLAVESYPAVKKIYSEINVRDQYALGFKRGDTDS